MRILLTLGLLVVACSAFAADVTTDSATGVVSLTVEKFVDVAPAAPQTITISNNGVHGDATLTFACVANCPAAVTFAITTSTANTGVVWSLSNASGVIAAPGGNATVKVNADTASQLLAGSDSCTVTATING